MPMSPRLPEGPSPASEKLPRCSLSSQMFSSSEFFRKLGEWMELCRAGVPHFGGRPNFLHSVMRTVATMMNKHRDIPDPGGIWRKWTDTSEPVDRVGAHETSNRGSKWLQTQAPAGILDTDRWAREAFPDEEPDWNPNSEDERAGLERYRLAFLQGVRAGAKKPTNMAKTSEVFQKPDESPAAFYERLCEAYWIYTPFRPETPENQTMVNAVFVGQAQPDIRRKLQKLEGFAGKKATELLEIANKVFINRDSAARKEEEKRIQRRANIVAAAFRGSGSQTDQKGKQEYRSGGKGRASLR
ncbi:hypothetical protein QTO34_016924 [Cnephaeus nilssonii]|uniref:Core shell protein Gag P30 domain-containing protein n=1 Tax=Cnephaeus nilssonii TaxID=3371016 RepID=A0AA40LSA5_CNENI|nr:hypothetical protein QTO34_016924 [Eptesicus nilssonii]